ncbi:hypothetical protein [Pseudomonas sp. B11(2017)]|uniref:hypothetical protein n=1 Tax=Pseudomonas sp. B11(2017) TaxID=1981748 RepID=UPI00111C8DF7|nr:hypothetical protein [Pseudomonas sp. B11(2017)]
MSKNYKHSTLLERLKAYCRPSESEAEGTAPFHVTSTGALYADANELIHAQVVQKQLIAFASLDSEIKKTQKEEKAESHQ